MRLLLTFLLAVQWLIATVPIPVQTVGGAVSLSSPAVTTSMTVTNGNMILVVCTLYFNGSACDSPTDTLGNIYVHIADSNRSGTHTSVSLWYVSSSIGGSDAVSCSSAGDYMTCVATEISNQSATPLDSGVTVTNNQTSASPSFTFTSGASGSTSQDQDLVIAVGALSFSGTPITAGSGWNLIFTQNQAGLPYTVVATATTSSIGSYNANFVFTSSGNGTDGSTAVVAFKSANPPTGTTRHRIM